MLEVTIKMYPPSAALARYMKFIPQKCGNGAFDVLSVHSPIPAGHRVRTCGQFYHY